jgi:hypothetical protein
MISATQRRVLSNRLCSVKERGRNKGDRNRIREKGWKKMKVRKEDRGKRNRFEINYEMSDPNIGVAQDIFCDVTPC